MSPTDHELHSTATYHKEQGNVCFRQGRFVDAIREYSKAINLIKTVSIFYSNRANCYIRLGMFQEAIDDCRLFNLPNSVLY
jgi:Flp pilus assembly protein TadD